jgi:hypothetical protein
MEVGEPRIVTAPESNSETCTEPDFPIDPESPKDGRIAPSIMHQCDNAPESEGARNAKLF